MSKLIKVVMLVGCLFGKAFALPITNGDFGDNLTGWTAQGDVNADSGYALLGDISESSPAARLYQVSSIDPGYYVLSFDFQPQLGTEVELGTFPDTFFSSLYFHTGAGLDLDLKTFTESLGLIDADKNGIVTHQGEVTASILGDGWYHYVLNFTSTLSYVAPVFELFNLNGRMEESRVGVDNVSIVARDFCPDDPVKTLPGACGCGVPDTDADGNEVPDCLETCKGECSEANPGFDEDEDGVSNCQEVLDGTNACDSGSFIAKLKPQACAGANGFFSQTNIATVINHEEKALGFWVEYRDAFGTVQGSVWFELGPQLKRDVIVNDLGLKEDSYGTVCVFTDAASDGAWSGGITLYKQHSSKQAFDFALHYPFVNPKQGKSSAPINTNTLDPGNQEATVANWVRLTDAAAGDGIGLKGTLFYYNIDGVLIDYDDVNLPDGGRFDYAAHERLGVHQVGLAEFLPVNTQQGYFFEVTRYYYQGLGAWSHDFVTAFPLPNRPSTGEAISAEVGRPANELHIVEMINDNGANVPMELTVYDAAGAKLYSETNYVPSKSSIHRIIGDGVMAAGTVGVAEVSVPKISLSAITLAYARGKDGELLYGYAPPFLQSHGKAQFTQFNTFLEHKNRLSLVNTNQEPVEVRVRAIDWQGTVLAEYSETVAGKGIAVKELSLPADSYGTLVVSADVTGIVVRNDVIREGEYVMVFVGG